MPRLPQQESDDRHRDRRVGAERPRRRGDPGARRTLGTRVRAHGGDRRRCEHARERGIRLLARLVLGGASPRGGLTVLPRVRARRTRLVRHARDLVRPPAARRRRRIGHRLPRPRAHGRRARRRRPRIPPAAATPRRPRARGRAVHRVFAAARAAAPHRRSAVRRSRAGAGQRPLERRILGPRGPRHDHGRGGARDRAAAEPGRRRCGARPADPRARGRVADPRRRIAGDLERPRRRPVRARRRDRHGPRDRFARRAHRAGRRARRDPAGAHQAGGRTDAGALSAAPRTLSLRQRCGHGAVRPVGTGAVERRAHRARRHGAHRRQA